MIVQYRKRDVPGICEICGAPFTGYAGKQYCSKKCQNKAYWLRHREQLNEQRRSKKNPAES